MLWCGMEWVTAKNAYKTSIYIADQSMKYSFYFFLFFFVFHINFLCHCDLPDVHHTRFVVQELAQNGD